MKSTILKKVEDDARFIISTRKGAAIYILQSKIKGIATYTSTSSGRTYSRSWKIKVFVIG